MGTWAWVGVGVAATLVVYALFVLALIAAGRHSDARALAGFIPDCVVLFRRLLGDPHVPRSRKLLLYALLAYLVLPIDLVPDFIPIAGQLDDAILAALVLRAVARGGGPDLVREHWPGPATSMEIVLRLAYGKARGAAQADTSPRHSAPRR